MPDMKRREFTTLLGGGGLLLAAKVKRARGQQPAIPVIGFLSAGAREPLRQQIAAFLEGLKETGYVEGQNVAVEYRFTEGVNSIDFRRSRPIWFAARWPCCLWPATLGRSPQSSRLGQFRSSSLLATIPSRPGSSRASTDPEAT